MDRIAAMNAFVRVVEAGTFTKAADTLNVPNATVTRLIQSLEHDLKVQLLHRTTRSVTVTPEGATYYERIVALLADLADIESSTAQAKAKPAGKVRVESAAAIGSLVIIPALGSFHRDFPDLEIELGVSNRVADLVAEGVDCAIRVGTVSEQMLVARRVGEFHFVTCATPKLLADHGTPTTPQDLLTKPTVGMMSAKLGKALPFQFSGASGEVSLPLSHKLVVNDTTSYLAAAVAGIGMVQTPSYAVQDAFRSGQLVPVLQDWDTPVVPIHVVYPPNRYLSAKVRVFIDWTIALFERHPHLKLH